MSNTTDVEFINGFESGNFALISEFYEVLLRKAKANLKTNLFSSAELEDVIQEAVISVYTNIRKGKYQHNPQIKLSSYALKICQYRMNNLLKKKGRGSLPTSTLEYKLADDLSPHEYIEVIERNQIISENINRLGENCRKILRLFYWEKQSIGEIAAQLSMQSNSVKNGKYRCMQRLTALLYKQKEAGRL